MNRYWFFPATLPGFLFGASPPMSGEDFLVQCKRYLSPEDYGEMIDAIECLIGDRASGSLKSKFLKDFAEWERAFRNELARLRARRSGRNEGEYLRPAIRSDEASRAAALCFSSDDPYQAELLFERERWNAIERLLGLSTFNLDFLVAYRLRLAIAERLEHLNVTAGEAGYRHFYGDIIGRTSPAAETEYLGEKA